MTNEQIIEGLECCRSSNFNTCGKCPYLPLKDEVFTCIKVKQNNTIDLIERLKLEINQLETENKILSQNADNAFQEGLNESRALFKSEIEPEIIAEAIKEFASDFVAVARGVEDYKTNQIIGYIIPADRFEALVKERLEPMKRGVQNE